MSKNLGSRIDVLSFCSFFYKNNRFMFYLIVGILILLWSRRSGFAERIAPQMRSVTVRRAAYHMLQWLDERELPKPTGDAAMLQALLARQLAQQAQGAQKAQAPGLAQRLVALTLKEDEDKRNIFAMTIRARRKELGLSQ